MRGYGPFRRAGPRSTLVPIQVASGCLREAAAVILVAALQARRSRIAAWVAIPGALAGCRLATYYLNVVVPRVSELGGDGLAGHVSVIYLAGLSLAWQVDGNSGVVEVAAEAGGHVAGGRGGLGEVPGAVAAAALDVGGVAGGVGVPGDEQGLDEEPERDGPLDGPGRAVAGV